MRKDGLKLIKKTERWLHRKRGTYSFRIPEDLATERITRFVLLGSSEVTAEGGLRGVGDYDPESGRYAIVIHVHGNNLLGGYEFGELHIAKQICTVSKPTLSATNFIFIPDVDKEGTPIVDRSVIRFKEKTPYTLAYTVKYMNTAKPRDLKLTFKYTDGTSFTPTYDTTKKTFTDCKITDPEKTVECISTYAGDNKTTVFVIADFGIYEGAHPVHAEVQEPYIGEKIKIELDAPLYSIGYASDELDLKNGTLLRKIERLRVDSSADVRETETEGVFEIKLPYPMRRGGATVSPYGEITDSTDGGISASEDGTAIFFKPEGEPLDLNGVGTYLSDNPFDLFYILDTPKLQTLAIDCPDMIGKNAVDILTDVPARKCFVEYY